MNKTSTIGKAFKKAERHFLDLYRRDPNQNNRAYEMAMASVLSEFNTGITLSKKNDQGNFRPLVVRRQAHPLYPQKSYYLQDCPYCINFKILIMKKKIISSLIILMLFVSKSNAQTTGVPDTLAYLQTIVANKAQYIGQPLSLLINHLQIQVKEFTPFGMIHHKKDKETSTAFGFYCPNSPSELYKLSPTLEVFWNPYLNKSNSMSFFTLFGGCWAPQVYTHYANEIVRDIRILK